MAEEEYTHMFRKNGRRAKDIPMDQGALLIQKDLKSSDKETVQNIKGSPSLQHFIGMEK